MRICLAVIRNVAPLLWVLVHQTAWSHSRPISSADPEIMLQINRQNFKYFDEARESQRRYQENERRKIPAYNCHLSQAVVAFHRHILKDDHYLLLNCSVCRGYFAEIRSYFKKIQNALK